MGKAGARVVLPEMGDKPGSRSRGILATEGLAKPVPLAPASAAHVDPAPDPRRCHGRGG